MFIMTISIGTFINPMQTEAATNLKANTWYDFSLTGGTTSEMEFVMPAKGYFYVEVLPVSYTNKGEVCGTTTTWAYVPVKIEANYKVYEQDDAYIDDGVWKSKAYSFKKSTRVKIKATSSVMFSKPEYVLEYKIRVVTKKPGYFEKESNNSKSKAMSLKANKTYSGIIMKDDTDWFVYKVPKTGKYKISAVYQSTDDSSNAYFNSNVYKSSKLLKSKQVVNGRGWTTLYSGKLKKGQKIYIKMNQDWYYYGLFYKVKVKKY